MNSSRVAVLGTWSFQDLDKLSEGGRLPADVVAQGDRVKWAPNGKHLAVLCGSCTLVMTFGGC